MTCDSNRNVFFGCLLWRLRSFFPVSFYLFRQVQSIISTCVSVRSLFCSHASTPHQPHVHVSVHLNGKTIRLAAAEPISLLAGGGVCRLVSPAHELLILNLKHRMLVIGDTVLHCACVWAEL